MADYVIDFYLLSEHCAVCLEAFVKLWNHMAVRDDAFTAFGGGLQKSARWNCLKWYFFSLWSF